MRLSQLPDKIAIANNQLGNATLVINTSNASTDPPSTYKIDLRGLGYTLIDGLKLVTYDNTNDTKNLYAGALEVDGDGGFTGILTSTNIGQYISATDRGVLDSAVTNITYDGTNKKFTQTKYGTTTNDIVTITTLKSDLALAKSDVGLSNVENKSSATIRGEITSSNVTTALGYTPLDSAQKGANNGVAELDANGHVPSSQLPSYVDDVIEVTSSTFPSTGETGKIYVDTTTNTSYRWSGSQYVKVASDLALGETSSTAYAGDKGKVAYDHATAKGSAFASGFYKITTNAEGHVTATTAVSASDITAFLGSAATKDVPASGDASTTEVVLGNDSRLSDDRNAADVPTWAKAADPPSTFNTITIGNTTLNESQLIALLALLEE